MSSEIWVLTQNCTVSVSGQLRTQNFSLLLAFPLSAPFSAFPANSELKTQHSELFTQYLTVIQPITRLPIVSAQGMFLVRIVQRTEGGHPDFCLA